MSLLDFLLGRRLASSESENERIAPWTGVSNLGLDALGSASYGPEAALTVLLPLGALGTASIQGVLWVITLLLAILFFSYRQTIAAYPDGGGSYMVAKENLGRRSSLVAAAALLVDYILNVAVGISAGIGALESAFPALQEHTLSLCLVVLGLITLANLRGVRQVGRMWLLPTYLFVVSVGLILLIGIAKSLLSGGHPLPVEPPPALPAATTAASLWLLMHAFAGGCTAMTGVEAVSNAVPIFREPRVPNAQRTLMLICLILAGLLLGIGYLANAYRIGARYQDQPGYQNVISQLAGAAVGHGWLYYLCIGSVLAVLVLSANTSFAAFPRLCHLLARDGFLPVPFASLGRRLVYTEGVVVLALISATLLIVFDGITDRLIPLFAVGAFSAFTFSQSGMTLYWRREKRVGARMSLFINGVGAVATGCALVVILVAKFADGAWMTIGLIAGLALLFGAIGRHYRRIRAEMASDAPLRIAPSPPPLFVVPVLRWNRLAQRALELSTQLGPDVVAVHFAFDEATARELQALWREKVEDPAREAGHPPPRLEIVPSPFRLFFEPLLAWVRQTREHNPGRTIAIVIPEMVQPKWWEYALHNYSVAALKTLLLLEGGERILILNLAWHLRARRRAKKPWRGRRGR